MLHFDGIVAVVIHIRISKSKINAMTYSFKNLTTVQQNKTQGAGTILRTSNLHCYRDKIKLGVWLVRETSKPYTKHESENLKYFGIHTSEV